MEQEKEGESDNMVESSSRANVQALLALFGQKDQPVMGMLQPGCKINNKSFNKLSPNSFISDKNGNETLSNATRNSSFVEKNRSFSLPLSRLSTPDTISAVEKKSPSTSPSHSANNTMKPLLKPKPFIAQKPVKCLSTNFIKPPTNEFADTISEDDIQNQNRISSHDENGVQKTNGKELINEIAKVLEKSASQQSLINSKMFLAKMLEKHPITLDKEINGSSSPNSSPTSQSLSFSKFTFDECSLTSDNYVCKNNKRFRKKELPPKEKLGPAPLKPVRLLNIRPFSSPNICTNTPPPLPERSLKQALPEVNSNVPMRPARVAPLPPKNIHISKPENNSSEEDELYMDTASPTEEKQRPVSMIPEYTEEEELGSCRDSSDLEELYADGVAETPLLATYPLPMKPNKPPPAIPGTPPEELYQDAIDPNQEEVYEEMPDEIHHSFSEQETPLYTNRKDQDKSRRDEEKRQKREQKEQEKREKEWTKLKKKYGLTGDEIPVDSGLVKADCRGGWYDLSVRRGETLLILRMENNPSGKWLVKNERGKIGYVELTNIEVDADSIKSVMSIRRMSSQSISEDLYCDASTEEAIYEETY